jgi:hypothetical protein
MEYAKWAIAKCGGWRLRRREVKRDRSPRLGQDVSGRPEMKQYLAGPIAEKRLERRMMEELGASISIRGDKHLHQSI